ncbi:hypothetical protein TYRP_001272 [Tyrophagus putrescentiae]|nr:hypothetical protein TYRP_001272 [Tyrophagus putrescentiae]
MLMITAPENSERKVVSRVAVNEYNQTVSWTARSASSSSAFDLCSPAEHCQSVPRIVGAFNFNRTMYLFGSDHMVYIVVLGKDGLNFERNQSISFEHFFICSKDTAVKASLSDMILKVAIWIVFFFAVMLLIVVMLTSCDDQPRVFQSELAVDVIKTQLKHVKKHRSSSGGDGSRHQLTGDGGRPKQSNSSRSHPGKILTGNSSARSKSKTQRKTLFTTLLRSRRLKTLKTTANTAVKSRKTRGKSAQKSSDKSISEKNNSLAKRVKNYVSTSERPVMKTTVSGKSRAKERTKSIKGSIQSRSRSARSSKSASKSKSKSNSSKK